MPPDTNSAKLVALRQGCRAGAVSSVSMFYLDACAPYEHSYSCFHLISQAAASSRRITCTNKRNPRDAPVEQSLDEEDLLGLDLDICSLTLGTAEGLVDHDARVGQRFPLAGSAGAQEEGTHGSSSAEAHSGDVTWDVLHGIVDGHTGRHRATGGVD